MKLLLKRIARKKTYTIGRLYVDGVYVGDTMEDRDRFYFGEKKVYGETAIPCGTYDITMNIYSPKFGAKYFYKNLCKGYLPRLQNVPQFNGVLIHCGNYAGYETFFKKVPISKNKQVLSVQEYVDVV